MATPPPKRKLKPATLPSIPNPPPSRKATHKRKAFKVSTWTGSGEGEKVVGYGPSGVGKTSLFAMMPGAVFIGVDDGGRRIRHPQTGEPLNAIRDAVTFQDVRDAIHQAGLIPKGGSLVIDTLTVLETLAEQYMFDTIPHEKGGRVHSIEGYGYGKGYTHLHETMRLLLQDLDGLVRRGVNVGLICQSMAIRKANPGGVDYLYDGPKLSHPSTEKNSVRLLVCEWADHVVNVAYRDQGQVEAARGAKVGKAKGDTTRVVFTDPQPHFFAKSRTLQYDGDAISFEAADDDSLWFYLFPED